MFGGHWVHQGGIHIYTGVCVCLKIFQIKERHK